MPIRNVYRTLGTMVGYEITKRYGEEGLPDDTIDMTFHGAGGQSIGAFIPRGETIRVYGEVNDYAGKGLSGGRMIVRPEDGITFDPHENVIAGNVTGFGATSGQMFVAGRAGERFAVRNGGATFVVEGVGDHGCEYMTGGTVVILGSTGRNLGAGFSGGNVYVLDLDMKQVNPAAATNGALLFEPLDAECRQAGACVWSSSMPKRPAPPSQGPARRLGKQRQAIHPHRSEALPRHAEGDEGSRGKEHRFQYARRLGTGVRAGYGRSALTWEILSGFLKVRTRRELAERPVEERIKDWFDVHTESGLQSWTTEQAARCMDCGTPFCMSGCPLGNIIPEFNDLVRQEKWEDAYNRLSETNNFPEVTGRICPALCEAACVLGIHQPATMIQNDERTIIDQAWSLGYRQASAAAASDRPDRCRGRFRPIRSRLRPAAHPCRPHRGRIRA